MPQLEDFDLNTLMLFIIGCLSAVGGLCLVIQKSKCKSIDLCCLKIVRDVDAILEEEKITMRQQPNSEQIPMVPELDST